MSKEKGQKFLGRGKCLRNAIRRAFCTQGAAGGGTQGNRSSYNACHKFLPFGGS